MEGMRNEYFPEDLPSDIAERFDGILDDAEGLEKLRSPTIEDLIEQLIEIIDGRDGDLGEHGRGTTEPTALWDVVCSLKTIAILAKLRDKQPVA